MAQISTRIGAIMVAAPINIGVLDLSATFQYYQQPHSFISNSTDITETS